MGYDDGQQLSIKNILNKQTNWTKLNWIVRTTEYATSN